MGKIKPGLIVPTEQELKHLLFGKVSEIKPFYGQTCYTVRWAGFSVVCVTSGIGKANAAFATTALFFEHKPSCIIHAGCAGTYVPERVGVGDVVVISEALFGDDGVLCDDGVMQSCKAMGIPLYTDEKMVIFDRIRAQEDLISLLTGFLPAEVYSDKVDPDCAENTAEGKFRLYYGSVLSVCSVSGSLNVAKRRYRSYGAEIEDMETAAVMLIGRRLGVPVLAVRGVSNVAGHRDKKCWRIDLALRNVGMIVQKCLLFLQELLGKEE